MASEKDFWFLSQSRNYHSNNSPWLNSTLSELDAKTQQMLKLIEEDEDSFAKRAEMYYKKRPQLVSMIEDFYRNHRSLAEQYDQLKHGYIARESTTKRTSLHSTDSPKIREESSEVVVKQDRDEDDEKNQVKLFSDKESVQDDKIQVKVFSDKGSDDDGLVKLKCTLDELREERDSMQAQLAKKDEEKVEAIRQLTLSMNILRDENNHMKEVMKGRKKKGGIFRLKKIFAKE